MHVCRKVAALAVLLLATPGLSGRAGAAPVGLRGAYDGSDDPASPHPPGDNGRWLKTVGHGCRIEPNTPSGGVALFADDELQGGSVINIKRRLDAEADFGGRPMETEYEFSIRVTVQSAGTATTPNFQAGFRDEGGLGRCVCLAWYRTAPQECLLAFMQSSPPGPIVPVTCWNWLDHAPHTYTVKKYRDPNGGKMVVQVLIDGEPQFHTPVPYERLPRDTGSGEGFQFGTSSYAKGRYVLDDLRFGPLQGVPPVAAQDAILTPRGGAEVTTVVAGPWQLQKIPGSGEAGVEEEGPAVRFAVNGRAKATSGRLTLKPNRMYVIKGTCEVTGDVSSVAVGFEQLSKGYDVPAPLPQETPLPLTKSGDATAFEFPVYLRMENELAALTLSVEGRGGRVTLRELTVTGGGPYRPGHTPFPPEKPAYDNTEVDRRLAARGSEAASVTRRNGFPSLRAGAEEIPPFFHVGPMVTSEAGGWWGAFGKAGVHLQSVHGRLSADKLRGFWEGPGHYGYATLEEILRTVLRRDADARIILGVWLDPFDAWGQENRDEVCQSSTGLYAIGKNHFSGWSKEPGNLRFLPSIFSRKVGDEIVEMLCAMDAWLSSHEIGRAVAGYYLWGFNDADFGHWVHPGTSAGEKSPDDYSPAALAAWRSWLRERYGNDPKRLQESWGRHDADFDTVALPSPERRRTKGGDSFPWLLEREDQEIVDFNRFYGETPSRFIEHIIAGMRQRTGTGRLFVLHNGNAMHGWRGYTGFGRISKVPGLDCISATSDYGLRVPGYPGGCDSIPESLGLQGKLFFHEFDYRSHCSPTEFESMDFGVGRSSDAAMHRAMLLREATNMLARGHGLYCMDMSGQWYADPAIMDGVKDVCGLFRRQLDLAGPPLAEVAYFLGEDSINYLGDSDEASRFLMRVTRRHRPEWDTAGVPYHLYLQRDIADPNLPEYKVYVFLMPQKIDDSERRAIESLKRDGHTLVFLHAPGICDSTDPQAALRSITGIRTVRIPGNDRALAGTWLETGHPLLEGLRGRFGDRPIRWRFTDRESKGLAFAIEDPEAIPLATYRDHDTIAAAVREFGSWRSVYLAVPWLEARLIANIAQGAGAWRVADPYDAVFANQHFIGIHAMAAGTKRLRPRQKSRVTDAFNGKLIADEAEEFSVDLPFGVTRVFRTEGLAQ